jgi:hypothetical protein
LAEHDGTFCGGGEGGGKYRKGRDGREKGKREGIGKLEIGYGILIWRKELWKGNGESGKTIMRFVSAGERIVGGLRDGKG